MGLDMFLFACNTKHDPANEGLVPDDWREVAYWRKSNAIHRWFVENVQGGVDECQPSPVHPEQLGELYQLCLQVLANPELGPKLLPTQGGFFFGDTGYDGYYLEDIEETVRMLDAFAQSPDFVGSRVVYQASW